MLLIAFFVVATRCQGHPLVGSDLGMEVDKARLRDLSVTVAESSTSRDPAKSGGETEERNLVDVSDGFYDAIDQQWKFPFAFQLDTEKFTEGQLTINAVLEMSFVEPGAAETEGRRKLTQNQPQTVDSAQMSLNKGADDVNLLEYKQCLEAILISGGSCQNTSTSVACGPLRQACDAKTLLFNEEGSLVRNPRNETEWSQPSEQEVQDFVFCQNLDDWWCEESKDSSSSSSEETDGSSSSSVSSDSMEESSSSTESSDSLEESSSSSSDASSESSSSSTDSSDSLEESSSSSSDASSESSSSSSESSSSSSSDESSSDELMTLALGASSEEESGRMSGLGIAATCIGVVFFLIALIAVYFWYCKGSRMNGRVGREKSAGYTNVVEKNGAFSKEEQDNVI